MTINIEAIKSEYQSLLEKISEPELISDWNKMEELTKKKDFFEKIIEKEKEINSLKETIEENKSILKSQEDQELSSLAEAEISQLNEQLKNYDFGLLTSKVEGLSNTVIEYMSMALPCITTRSGALTELIEHEKNGLLFDYKDIPALVRNLKRCIEMDNETYSRFSLESHQTVSEKFNLESNVEDLEGYFEKIITKYSH